MPYEHIATPKDDHKRIVWSLKEDASGVVLYLNGISVIASSVVGDRESIVVHNSALESLGLKLEVID